MTLDTWTGQVLQGEDTNQVLAVVANLASEVADLKTRVSALEQQGEGADGQVAALQEEIDTLVARVFSPLQAPE